MPYAKKGFDGRTRVGRSIRDIKKLVVTDLDSVAVKILQNDIANLSVVGRLCLERALSNPDETVDAKGKLHPAFTNYLKCQGAVKAGLVALKKFDQNKAKGLAGLFGEEDDGD
jgi:hypothetical protein